MEKATTSQKHLSITTVSSFPNCQVLASYWVLVQKQLHIFNYHSHSFCESSMALLFPRWGKMKREETELDLDTPVPSVLWKYILRHDKEH